MATQGVLHLADLLQVEHILCDLPPLSRDEAVTRLIARLAEREGGIDQPAALRAVLDREKLGATIILPGVAMPHARLDLLDAPRVALATSRHGIDFNAEGEAPARLVVLILTPKADPGAYLRLVAALSRVLSVPHLLSRLVVGESPQQIRSILHETDLRVPAYLTARDVMDPHPVTLKEGDTLATALQTLFVNRLHDAPVVDETGDLRGVVSLEDILHLSLPEHLLWMEDLSSILSFQPFADLLRKDQETRLADFLRENYVDAAPDTPAIQLAKLFLMKKHRQIEIVEGRRLLGVVDLDNFMAQLFWA